MGNIVTIRKGYDLKLNGIAEKTITDLPFSEVVAIKPPDFPNLTPRLAVEVGQEVLAGQALFLDKRRPELLFTSPVSGEVVEIVRGEKRRLLEVRVLPDRDTRYVSFPVRPLSDLSRDDLIAQLLESGCWAYLRQRPYSLIADPQETPKAIFVSGFDSAPLAPDLRFIIDQSPDLFHTGLNVLKKLADGNLHVSLPAGANGIGTNEPFGAIPPDRLHYFKGPHPAGNVGIQVHHLDPLRKGEVVWYVHPQDVIILGRLFAEGRYRADRVVALTGSCVGQPQYFRLMTGQRLDTLLNGRLNAETCRVIQGNVLSGEKTAADDFLSFRTNHITVLPEGYEPQFLGWLTPGLKKLSLSRTFFSWLFPNRSYSLDTNTQGEERAFVMTGQYEKVLPMNILPVFLLKAILAKDIERMEQLGIYEVSEEDFALCEFVCTSKIDVQRIITEGLELVRLEG